MSAHARGGSRLFWLVALGALSLGALAVCQPRAKGVDKNARVAGPQPDDGDAEAYADAAMASDGAEAAFLREALRSGVAELSLAEFARDHAQSGAVKSLATALSGDHAALNDRLRARAGGSADPAPTARQRSEAAHLRALEGAAFDDAWLEHLSRSHARAIARFQAVASGADSAETRTLASEALPTLRSHRDRIALLRQGVATPSPSPVPS